MAYLFIQTVTITSANGRTQKLKGMAHINISKECNILARGKMTFSMVTVSSFGKMEPFSKENSFKARKYMESSIGQMDPLISDNSTKIDLKAKEN